MTLHIVLVVLIEVGIQKMELINVHHYLELEIVKVDVLFRLDEFLFDLKITKSNSFMKPVVGLEPTITQLKAVRITNYAIRADREHLIIN